MSLGQLHVMSGIVGPIDVTWKDYYDDCTHNALFSCPRRHVQYTRKEACLLSAIRSAVQDLMQVEPEAVRADSARSLANPAK